MLRKASVLALLLVFVVSPALAGGERVIATLYGDGRDAFAGRKHAAYWHRKTPPGWPEECCPEPWIGVATRNRKIPFGTCLHVRWVNIPPAVRLWAGGRYDHLFGRETFVVVVDRKAAAGIDLWPTAWDRLTGARREIGVLVVEVEPVSTVFCRWAMAKQGGRLRGPDG